MSVEPVLQALSTLYGQAGPAEREQANKSLQEFQKTDEAWQTANLMLQSPDAPQEARIFAGSTFRQKIVYDLGELPSEHRLPLRDTLLSALKSVVSGPRSLITQLCLALADLLLQIPEWTNGVQDMIEQLGSAPETVLALLEFLTVLPQEVTSNLRIRISNEDWRTQDTGQQVINLISMYFSAPGVTSNVRQQTLQCLAAWLRAGEIRPQQIQASPFFDFAFTSLSSDELFDDSIDLLCDLIHETQEVGDNLPVIEAIVPRLVALRPNLANAVQAEDADQVRGFCRLYVEAGEWYAQIMLQHPEQFLPIVEAIADCSAFDDLDVVTITLNFWWKLAVGLRKGGFVNDPQCKPFLDVIARLVDIIIKHLHYPSDPSTLSAQDRDDFRSFRHNIGDTLKDCCSVLGATACLQRSFSIIEEEVGKGQSGRWQAIEAGLFSMRAMGAQVDTTESEVMPRIFAVIPQLPQTESKIRYAATLVVGRYTEWLAVHPDLIPQMLEYVLSGFNVAADEVAVASAQALKYLCKDCAQHLVSYLSPLFEFAQQNQGKMHQDDLLEISSGYASIIATMQPQEAIPALQTFCAPLLEKVHQLTSRTDTNASKADLVAVADALERLNVYLQINAHLSDSLPDACGSTTQEVWQLIDSLLLKYGNSSIIAERTCSTIRRGLTFFGRLCLPVAPAILERMTQVFEQTGISGYVWITGRVPDLLRIPGVQVQNSEQTQIIRSTLQKAFESITAKLVQQLGNAQAQDVQDVIEDYLHFMRNLIEDAPDLILSSPAFPASVQIAVTAVSLLSPIISLDGLDAVRLLVGHDSLRGASATPSGYGAPSSNPAEAAQFPAFSQAIRSVISNPEIGARLVHLLLSRLVTDFHEDCSGMAVTLARLLAERFPTELAQWVPAALATIPAKDLRDQERQKFLDSFTKAMNERNLGGVRNAWSQLDRASRKQRERLSIQR